MSIDMYLEAARTQAESLGRAVEQCLGQNLKLISVLSAFHNEHELKGKAYDSAKNHVVGTVIPIVQGVILYQEAIALACQNFVSNYTAEVDGKSWRQSELEEKIRFAEQQLAELERKSQLYANNKGMSIVDFSASIAVAESARQVFQEILDNLLAFNESSPTIFAEAETYLAAASTGLSQAAQSWDTSTQTYLPPRRDADLSWKGTINTGWTKRQERIEETKSQQSFVKYIDELSFSEMEERYGKLISEYESYLNTGYNFPQRGDLTAEQINYIYSRYQYLREGGGAIYIESESSKKMKANLLASDKEEVDGMSLVELADKYPEFLRGRISIEFDYIFMSDEEKAKKDYSYVRFNQLMNAEPIDWRDPDYAAKRNKYILETGKNPSTNEPATEAEIITAKNYGWVKAIPDTVAWTDMMVGSYVGHQVYNGKPVYGIDTNFAGELRNPIVSSQTVFGPQLPSKNWTLELPKVETKTIMGSQSMVSEINPGGNTDAPAINTGGVEVSNNLKFNLNDIDSFDNANIKSVEAFLDNELQGYRKAPLKRGDGVRYYDGKGNSWQLNYGYENATDNIHGKPYLKTTYNGEIVRIPLQK
ncbi:hypothetical protein [Streptococcus sanguinis]|uniref:hypothetical protein n=1 Tax=Streptococcus sanguinis TaxID=1305 RepID=UPI00228498DD|nr:hypothetical protein [Streptococcus sanguinis]MCY7015422.1 hypothetical protein [Streptococcus sanguinis]